jgi:molybdopterin/thiamine biosynthesis adenylyltransferase
MNKPSLTALIAGAGGVASYMLPALARSFELKGILMDADKLEEHNLDRQIFNKSHIGKNKAIALRQYHNLKGLLPLPEYIENDFVLRNRDGLKDIDVVIVLVDNHPARRACILTAEELEIPILLCGNEYETSQAIYYHPDMHEDLKPQARYPEIMTSDEGSPVNCTGEALESTPQLAIANQVAAGLGNYLLWLWHGDGHYKAHTTLGHEPIEIATTYSGTRTIKINGQ